MNYLQIGIDVILLGFLIYISIKDLKSHVIKNNILLIMLPIATLRAVIHCAVSDTPLMTLLSHLGGAAFAFFLFLAVAMFSGGRNVGGGDIKIAGILGICTGFQGILITLVCGMLAACVGGLVLGYLHKTRHVMIPLAPYLSIGFVFYLLHPLFVPSIMALL